MFEKNADLGRQFLFDNYDRVRLEVEYDFDAECIFIQLRDKEKGTCTVFDETGILAQVHEYAEKAKQEQTGKKPLDKLYKLTLNGEEFAGTAEDVARWYCKQKGIKLYSLPDQSENDALTLFAIFEKGDALFPVAEFEKDADDSDIETGYQLFFTKYMLTDDEPDFTITELS